MRRKVKDALKLAREAGWVHVRTSGSHRHFKHPCVPGTLTIAGKPSDDLHPKTWKSILNTINSDGEES